MIEIITIALCLISIVINAITVKMSNKTSVYEMINIDEIKLKKCFKRRKPKQGKMELKEQFYKEHGYFEDRIILKSNNRLLDGYTSYLLAKKYNITKIEIIRDKNV